MKIRVVFTYLFALMGCEEPPQLPSDFTFTATYSALQPGAGGNYGVRIEPSSIKDTFTVSVTRDASSKKFDRGKDEIQDLYEQIVAEKIFKMKDNYEDLAVLDGQMIDLSITANGRVKNIKLRNTVPKQLNAVFKAVNKITRQN